MSLHRIFFLLLFSLLSWIQLSFTGAFTGWGKSLNQCKSLVLELFLSPFYQLSFAASTSSLVGLGWKVLVVSTVIFAVGPSRSRSARDPHWLVVWRHPRQYDVILGPFRQVVVALLLLLLVKYRTIVTSKLSPIWWEASWAACPTWKAWPQSKRHGALWIYRSIP